MADDKNINEIEETKETKDIKDTNDNDSKGYEDVCYICHRFESVAGPMIHLPNRVSVCADCMQKTFDSISGIGPNPFIIDFDKFNDTNGNINAVNDENKDGDKKEGADNQSNMFGGFDFSGFTNFLDMGSFSPFGPQRVKKQEKKKNSHVKPVFSIDNMPHPHQIKEKLDDYVIGQDQAKKAMSVAVYNHYKRVNTNTMDEIEIEKSNILLLGPTGSGKTYLVRTLARLLDVPLAISDATSLTEAGYIGDDIESVVSKLLAAADNDVDKAERGIIFIDEIDKLAKKKNTNQRDVSGEAVQQGMLKLLEGSEVEVPVGASSKSSMAPLTTVDTRNILFIVGGAFPGLDEIIKERLNKSSSMGFAADLRDKYDEDKQILEKTTVEDLRNFGMIPEFLGRLPVIACLSALDEDMLVKILKEPKNAILKQYQKLLALDEVDLKFTDGALRAIAKKAMEKELGARALRAIIEEFMLDIMYEVPKDENIGTVTITEDYIEGKGGPLIEMRTVEKIVKQPEPETVGAAD